jgi:hypothetical protein
LDSVDAEYVDQNDVPHMTLKAFARERLRNGEEVPLELLGWFAGRKASIDNLPPPGKKQK